MSTTRQMKALHEKAPDDAISFKDIFQSTYEMTEKHLKQGEMLQRLSIHEKRNLNERLKRKFNYYIRTSKFPRTIEKDIENFISVNLEKHIVVIHKKEEIENDIDDETTPLDFDTDQKLVSIIELIEKTGKRFDLITQILISRDRLNIFGEEDEVFWVLLIGKDEEMGAPDEYEDDANYKSRPKNEVLSFWKSVISQKFDTQDDMDDYIFISTCTEETAQEYKEEYGSYSFYSLKFDDEGESESIKDLKKLANEIEKMNINQ